MDLEIIKNMVSNSTWIDPEKKITYKFSENNQLHINGSSSIQYSVKKSENKIVLQLGVARQYVVEYVCDFILKLYNEEEKFEISPA